MQQAIVWTNADPVHWHIYAALGEMSWSEEPLDVTTIKDNWNSIVYQEFAHNSRYSFIP